MLLLFVCSGNTCRSPMASALFNHLAAKRNLTSPMVALSAGLAARPGNKAASESIRLLAAAGVDGLEKHSARCICEDLVRDAAMILVMSAQQLEALANLYPHYRSKIDLLTAYAKGGLYRAEIADPYGGDLTAYCRAMKDIKISIENLLDWLAGKQ